MGDGHFSGVTRLEVRVWETQEGEREARKYQQFMEIILSGSLIAMKGRKNLGGGHMIEVDCFVLI